ncbi:MAG TPA: sulfatase-like hydrolase/transferase, partial [Tichowtungia sp.]|nr:sulfatase-like hydrolase/transferase [Tichowtungia sp.]
KAVMGFAYLRDHFRMPLFDWDPSGQYSKESAYLLTYDDEGKVIRRSITDEDKKEPSGTEADGPHSSEIFADGAIDLIKTHDSDHPFFMYLAFHAPHDPRQAPEAYRQLYPLESIELTPSYLPQHPFDNGEMTIRDEALAPWPRTPEIARQHLAAYYAIITHLDAQIGRVLAALESSGKADNTIIVFAGDSGLAVGNHGLMGKQNLYDEDGIHVPLVFAGKLKGGGKRIPAFSYLHDVFPTLCQLADVETPESVSGKSLVPLIRGEADQVRESTYHAYRNLMRAYRKGDFKLIEYFKGADRKGVVQGSRVTQLFNVKEDPWEMTDLSFLPEYRELVKQMQNGMKLEAKKLGDELQF